MPTFDTWFPYRRPAAGFELFAFPHIAAGPTLFHPLRAALAPIGVTLTAALPPGRGKRLREPPHRSMSDLVAEFADLARVDGYAAFQGEYGLVGHCSGALVAYEVAKVLTAAPCRNPALLIACSCLPPRLIRDTGTSRLPVDEMFARTTALGGTADALLADPGFRQAVAAPMRADWEIFDGYADRSPGVLPVPVLAVRGAHDASVPADGLQGWQDHSRYPLRTAEVDADHWVLTPQGSAVLAREISTALSVPTGAAR